MKSILRPAVASLLLLPALASAEGFNVSARTSTLGLGLEAGYAFNDYVNLRVALNNYNYDYDTTEDDIRYDFDLELESTALLLDIHPFAGAFRVTAGMLDNKNRLEGQAEATGSYDIGDVSYTNEEVGTLFSRVQLGEDNPFYLGLGWSQALGETGWGFGFDAGVVLLGDSEVELLPQGGSLIDDPAFQADIAAEEESAEADINESFETYPVLSLGVTYQF